MIVKITDIHDAHGASFRLVFEPENEADKKIFNCLKDLVARITRINNYKKKGYRETVLCSHIMVVEEGRVSIGFSEQSKKLARIDYLWNSSREDQKFVVVELEGDPENFQWPHDKVRHFECYWCHKDVFGVDREAIEVFNPEIGEKRIVQVHRECQKIREIQIASIPFKEN